MSCQANTTTIKMSEAGQAIAALPKTGVLRFERDGAAMVGAASITTDEGAMTLRFADGAAIYLKTA